MCHRWTNTAICLVATALLAGCATHKEALLPHNGESMLDIWQRGTGRRMGHRPCAGGGGLYIVNCGGVRAFERLKTLTELSDLLKGDAILEPHYERWLLDLVVR